jgi:hypothetical protein
MSTHVVERLSEYLDSELEPGEHAEVRAHLGECTDCRQTLEELRQLDDLARALPVPPGRPGTDLATRVRASLVGEAVAGRKRLPQALAAAAALAAVVALPWVILQQSPAPEQSAALNEPAALPSYTDDLRREEELLSEPVPAPSASDRPGVDSAQAPRGSAAETLAREKAVPRARGRELTAGGKRREEEARETYALGYVAPAGPAPGMIAEAPVADAPAAPPASASPAAPGAPAPAEATGQSAIASRTDVAEKRANAQRPAAVAARAGSSAEGARVGGSAADVGFSALESRTVTSGDEARRLRRDWRLFVRHFPGSPHLDDARFRALEAGARAYDLERRPDDLVRLRKDVEEYVAAAPPARAEAARRLLDEASRPPSP